MYIRGKGHFDSRGEKIGSKRKIDLQRAFVMGAENDVRLFTSLVIESRVSMQLLNEQFRKGRASKWAK